MPRLAPPLAIHRLAYVICGSIVTVMFIASDSSIWALGAFVLTAVGTMMIPMPAQPPDEPPTCFGCGA